MSKFSEKLSTDGKFLILYIRASCFGTGLLHLALFFLMFFGGVRELSYLNLVSFAVYAYFSFQRTDDLSYGKQVYNVMVWEIIVFVLIMTFAIKDLCLFVMFCLAFLPSTGLLSYVIKVYADEKWEGYQVPAGALAVTFLITSVKEIFRTNIGAYDIPESTRLIINIICLCTAFLTCMCSNYMYSYISANHVDHQEKRFEALSKKLVISMSNAMEAKDVYTKGHSERVAKYSVAIGKRMGLDSEVIEQLMYSGTLHDIGKIGIDDKIINKEGKLTEEEYAAIKTHPLIGYSVLEKIDELPQLATGARWHHERYDGKGYPDGLKGEEIPLIARIIGVADAYDAMTSNRSYRSYLPQEYVREELVKGKGTQFDPVIADVMIKILDEDKDYKLRE